MRYAIASAWLVGVVFCLLTGCPSTPPEQPHTYPMLDASDPADAEDPPPESARFPVCAKACAALRRIECPEGDRQDGGATCYAICARAEESGKFQLRAGCIAAAKTREDARACGTIRCLK